ncbi:MAG: hypothetical protein IH872_03255 [Chloroflexi bacterium]|nr:hypothetical protein [Chloroflexota bacterium]
MRRLTICWLPVLSALAVLGCSEATNVTPAPEQNPTPVIQIVVVTATPGPTSPPVIQTVVVTATPLPTRTPRPTLEAMAGMNQEMSEVQEISIIENYRATQFWPRNFVVIKDIPVRMYLTRLHREHVNRFTISPFFSSSEVILPGEVGVIEFVPDQIGEFKISNVGHGFDADLIVVETQAEANAYIADRGVQMYALIHDVDQFRLFPETIVVYKDIPVTIHNISLVAEHQVSIERYEMGEEINVLPGELTRFEFTPDTTGAFTILHEIHGFSGTLIVADVP